MHKSQVWILILPILLVFGAHHKEDSDTQGAHNETATDETPADVEPQSNVDKIVSGLKGLWKDFFTKYFVEKYRKLEDFFSSSKKVRTTDISMYLSRKSL